MNMELFEEAPNVTPGAANAIKFEDEVENVVTARSTNDSTLVSELYFLIAKFLSRGPLKHTAQTLLKEIETEEVLPRRLDWEGREHAQSFEQLEHQYPEISHRRLVEVCSRALRLAADSSVPRARLSILGAAAAGARPPRAPVHNVLQRVLSRERGDLAPANIRPFPAALLRGTSLQRRTLGHLSAVYCVVFAGRYVLTGADDFLLKLWSAEDGTLRRTYRGAAAEITDVCVTDDLSLLAAGCVDRTIRVWCSRTGAALAVLTGHAGTVTAVQWRPQTGRGPLLASTSTDGSVAFWSRREDEQWVPCRLVERTRPGACHTICAGWSAGGLLLATGSADHKVRVYRLDGDVHRELEMDAHGDAVDSVRWAHTGLRFVSGSKDGTAALWTLRAGRWRHKLLLRPDGGKQKTKVTMVCWDRSDQYIYIAVSDATIEMWSAMSGSMCRTLHGHGDEVYVLEPHPHLPGVLLSAGHDGQLRVWDSESECPCLSSHTNRVENESGGGQGEVGAVFDAKWSPCGSRVAATDSHGHLLLLGLGRGHHLLRSLPTELFFHTDYRPVSRSGSSGLPIDELSGRPPHLLPPPFLVDMEGSPLAGRWQRLVPGRGRSGGAEEDEESMGMMPESVPAVCERWLSALREKVAGMLDSETECYHREMRRKPHMIVTQPRPKISRRKPTNTRIRVTPELPPESATSEDEDSSIRLTNTDSDSSTASSVSMKGVVDACSSSAYSDWEAPAPAPRTRQTRRRRRRASARTLLPPLPPLPRMTADPIMADVTAEEPAPAAPAPVAASPRVPDLVPAAGDWLTSVFPRKSPYQPQIGDECVYFRVGHERYFDAVEEKQVYKLHPRDKPWFRGPIPSCELVRVTNIKFSLRPCRVASLRLVTSSGRVFTAKYHDMADVIDFLVLTQHYRTARDRNWKQGDRFRCVIDDCWWTGEVVENCAADECDADERDADESAPGYWERQAKHYLSIVVRWDNGEHDRLSPWDLEPCPGADCPGDAVPLRPGELDGPAYEPTPSEWPHGDRVSAAGCLAGLVAQVMCLSAAEPFSTPVDPSADPTYGTLVHYPIDLATIRARFSNLYYRRLSAAQMDAQYIAINAELISRGGGPGGEQLVKRATLVRDVLLAVMADWNSADVMAVYRKLAKDKLWPETCKKILREVWSSSDAEPFRSPVSLTLAPDYHAIVRNPCDLSLVSERLNNDQYRDQEQFCTDMRLIFRNSRLYNTNRRSRIYMMTARLSELFESLWSSVPRARCRRRMSSDDDETLADTSRRQRGTDVRWPDRRSTRHASPQPGTSTQQHPAYESESDVPLRHMHKRAHSSSSDTYSPTHNGLYKYNKRNRRRRRSSRSRVSSTSSSSSCSSSSGGSERPAAGKRYSSDHSYKPTYSTDDDQPLNKLREQSEQSTSNMNNRNAKRKPRFRAPRSAVSYNEESEEESAAAISKRERHARTLQRRSNNISDHTYHNGHATRQRPTERASSSSSSESPLSVSQRGRVRRLTEKARGLYKD